MIKQSKKLFNLAIFLLLASISINTLQANSIKPGKDEGTVDAKWFKSLITESKVPKDILLVNVLPEEEFAKGSIKNSINIEADKYSAKDVLEKLPKDKTIILYCSSGARALELWIELQQEGANISKIFYFDAVVECTKNDCKIEVNEPLE